MASKRDMICAVLFMLAVFITVFATLQEIPDDKVYTEIQKTLINGSWGILTCRFSGPPYAVYWKKGHDPWTAPTLMTWTPEGKTGPRYEDGTCDMDDNYSLVIQAVNYADAGRYICLVSNQLGVLIDNYTDVTVTDMAVKTVPSVAMQMGQTGILPCQVNIRPKKVSWMRNPNQTLITIDLSSTVIERGGPGYEKGLFNITKGYSLVIKDVTIFHEDRYLCEVIDFDIDNVYRDVTMLTVFAQPTEPFPTIKECPMEDQTNCIITTDSSTMLTCRINGYYPLIDLFFVHGSERLEPLTFITWNNTDGTKNKSIAISADTSNHLYRCVVSKIPGLELNDEISTAVRLIEKQRKSPIIAVILIAIVICLTVILLVWMRLRKRGRHPGVAMEEIYRGGFMEDHVSYVELWKLVENIFGNHETQKLDVITLLHGNERSQTDESKTNMDQDYYYKKLCTWKETCDPTINQRTALYDKCSRAGLKQSFSKVEDFRNDTSHKVPSCDLEHILWQINDAQNIRVFLGSLGVNMPVEMLSLRKKTFIQEAVKQLISWTKGYLPFNTIVIVSSALEKLGHSRADDNFFQIPAPMKEKMNNQELKNLVRNHLKNRRQRLQEIVESVKPSSEIMFSNALEENDEVLFNTEKMLLDWWEDTERSNYDKRLILKQVLYGNSNIIEYPVAIDHYISDEELKLIARSLNSELMKSVCDKLHITSLPEAADDEKQRFDALCLWRTSMNEKEWSSLYGQLRSALEEVGASGILPSLRSDPVHRAEYVDIAFDLLMSDVLPVARALDINVRELPAYRPVFEPSQCKKGTIGLVARLVENANKDDSRRALCSLLREAGFPFSITYRMLVNHMGYGELYAISDAMMDDDCGQGVNGDDEEKPPGEGDGLLCDNNSTSKEPPRKEKKFKQNLREIKKMLKLTDEDVAAHPLNTEPLDEFTLFKVWKERPHIPVFNERAAIIQGLLDIERPDIARSVIEGKYENTEVSLPFINHIVKRMDEHELRNFMETFGLQYDFGLDKVASQKIYGFLKNWKDRSSLLSRKKSKGYWDFSDKLVNNGFLDVAQEIIIIYK